MPIKNVASKEEEKYQDPHKTQTNETSCIAIAQRRFQNASYKIGGATHRGYKETTA